MAASDPAMFDLAREALRLAKDLQAEAPKVFLPPSEGAKPSSEQVLPHALVRGTRGTSSGYVIRSTAPTRTVGTTRVRS